MEGDDPLTWLLASYGETIRGDEDTTEDQVLVLSIPVVVVPAFFRLFCQDIGGGNGAAAGCPRCDW